MRLARLQCEGTGAPLGIEELAAAGQLDYLQIDYPRPRVAPIAADVPPELPEYASGFRDALQAIVKTLYLDPQLHVIASAGWADAYSCVEQAAAVLVESGCGDLPVAAVRGSNLLPILDMLEGEGVSLENAETGAKWRDLKAPVLAADLQLGAGPLALAMVEQARVIVAGAFDGRSPTIAAAVHAFGWKWRQYDLLAAAAAAAHAAVWNDWQAFAEGSPVDQTWRPNRIELDSLGNVQIEAPHADAEAASRLVHWVRDAEAAANAVSQADVRSQLSTIRCEVAGPGQFRLSGAQGSAGDDCWNLHVLYEAGYAVEALIEFAPESDPRWRRHLAAIARGHLQSDGLLTVEELQPLSGGGGWLHLAFKAKFRAPCQRFAERIVKLAAAHRPHVRLSPSRPVVNVHCGCWPIRVPRDAVDIAVETRLAREWV